MTGDFRGNRSVKLVIKIFPPVEQFIFVSRDLSTVLTECKTSERFRLPNSKMIMREVVWSSCRKHNRDTTRHHAIYTVCQISREMDVFLLLC